MRGGGKKRRQASLVVKGNREQGRDKGRDGPDYRARRVERLKVEQRLTSREIRDGWKIFISVRGSYRSVGSERRNGVGRVRLINFFWKEAKRFDSTGFGWVGDVALRGLHGSHSMIPVVIVIGVGLTPAVLLE